MSEVPLLDAEALQMLRDLFQDRWKKRFDEQET
jgi:hypothetical protein